MQNLHYIFCDNVQNDLVQWLMAKILEPASADWKTVQGPPWAQKKVFAAGDTAAQALFGSPHGSGIAWLLMQRRAVLGWKKIKTVTLWQDQVGPSLIFELEVGTVAAGRRKV